MTSTGAGGRTDGGPAVPGRRAGRARAPAPHQLGRGLSERELRQFETRMLGSAHAAEHALSRRLERARECGGARSPRPAPRGARARRAGAAASGGPLRAAFAPDTDGRLDGWIEISGDGHPRGAAGPQWQGAAVGAPGRRLLGSPRRSRISAILMKPAGDPAALKRVEHPPVDPATGLPFNLDRAGQLLAGRWGAARDRWEPRVCHRGIQ